MAMSLIFPKEVPLLGKPALSFAFESEHVRLIAWEKSRATLRIVAAGGDGTVVSL